VSWTWLDDGDAGLSPCGKMVTVEAHASDMVQLLGYRLFGKPASWYP
jgi:hypothetical protein